MRCGRTTLRGSHILALIAALLLCKHNAVAASSSTTPATEGDIPDIVGTSPATNLNYDASASPATCLRARQDSPDISSSVDQSNTISESRQQETGTIDPIALINSVISSTTATSQASASHSSPQTAAPTGTSTETGPSHETDDAFSDASFLSFEDWKKQILEKDKGAADVKDEKRRRLHGESQETLDSLGDDHEIDIDFGALFGDKKDHKQQKKKDEEKWAKKQSHDGHKDAAKSEPHKYRSKDAGKTCKERTNFASFDSGAQIMKANPEAQSASQILSENKDRYMLNTCSAKNKFLIVELTDSILVDTVALANFEFFSSTFRQFRISVNDQYPVKLDKWVDLGMFEAKNTREIQAFRVEDPRIWARYLRIEFLSQYGSEFYCPVSLLRVHGRTMIQDILSQEQGTIPEEEEEIEQEDKTPLKEEAGETMIPEAVADIVEEEERVTEGLKEAQAVLADLVKTAENIADEDSSTLIQPDRIEEVKHLLEDATTQLLFSPWSKTLSLEDLIHDSQPLNQCYPWEHELDNLTSQSLSDTTDPPENKTAESITSTEKVVLPDATVSPTSTRDASQPTIGHNVTQTAFQTITPSPVLESKTETSVATSEKSSSPSPILSSASSVVSAVVNNATSILVSVAQNASSVVLPANKTMATSSQNAQPTTQESFFKNVSKRLANLESDSTLSLKYIEEQSRSLREAFNKAEKRQTQKVTAFLENLNGTVVPQLKGYQEMYDTIWKSTVTELEGQRNLLKGETEALSERLRLLADELVFQKRMAIAQSVLLLLCLGLVIFGRYLPGGLEVWRHHAAGLRAQDEVDVDADGRQFDSGHSSPLQHRSPAVSPEPRRKRNGNTAIRPVGRRTHSNMSQRSHSGLEGPPTPFSDYSEVEAPSHRKEQQQAERSRKLYHGNREDTPFSDSEVIEGVGRRLPGDELPSSRQVDDLLPNLPVDNTNPGDIRRQLEEAVDKELLQAFSGMPHYSPPQRQSTQQSDFGDSPQIAHSDGQAPHLNQHIADLDRSWTDAGSPEQSRRQSRRASQSAQGGYVSDGGRSAGHGGPRIRVTSDTPRGQSKTGSVPASGSLSGGSVQGSPDQKAPRRFSIARKPLPALPAGEQAGQR